MKYIRTKDGKIYLIGKDLFEEDTFHFTDKDGVATILIEEQKLSILGKLADTIEELCDEFVEYNRERNKGFYIREYELKEVKNVVRKEPSILEHTDIFGAIWTSKGLIYVAKMNEKGELELL